MNSILFASPVPVPDTTTVISTGTAASAASPAWALWGSITLPQVLAAVVAIAALVVLIKILHSVCFSARQNAQAPAHTPIQDPHGNAPVGGGKTSPEIPASTSHYSQRETRCVAKLRESGRAQADDSLYRGETGGSANQPLGKGACLYADGSLYRGQFRSGKRHGEGGYTYASGDILRCTGTWREGAFVKGTIEYRDGTCFKGTCRNGIPFEGTMTWPVHHQQFGYLQSWRGHWDGTIPIIDANHDATIIYRNGAMYSVTIVDASYLLIDGNLYKCDATHNQKRPPLVYHSVCKFDGPTGDFLFTRIA